MAKKGDGTGLQVPGFIKSKFSGTGEGRTSPGEKGSHGGISEKKIPAQKTDGKSTSFMAGPNEDNAVSPRGKMSKP